MHHTKYSAMAFKFCPTAEEPDIGAYKTDIGKFYFHLKRIIHFCKPKEWNATGNIDTMAQYEDSAL